MDSILRFEKWYSSQCNGSWEHQFGVEIDTLDPGWWVIVDLDETDHQDAQFAGIQIEKSDGGWVHCWKDGSQFFGMGGPMNLNDIIEHFLSFISQ